MAGCLLVAAAAGLGFVPAAAGQQAALDYCTPGGGVIGAFTDAEHTVLLKEAPLPPGVRRTRETVDGFSTPVMEAGPSNASEAVVFLHGNPGSSRDFDQLLAAVGPFARAVAWDMPGFGHADKPFAGRYTTAGGAQFINDMLAHLRIARVHFVLHDFGGFWALQWAAEHTSRVASVTLIDTGVLTGYIGHPFAAIWDTPVVGEVDIGASSRAGFDLLFQAQNPRPLPSWFVDRMYDDFDRGTRCAVLSYYRDLGLPESRWEAQQAIFSKLSLPALVIWGADDPYEPSSQADNQKKSFPAAEVHVLPNTGHFPFIDEPKITRSLTVSFLRRVVTAQAAPVQKASPQPSGSRHKRRRAHHHRLRGKHSGCPPTPSRRSERRPRGGAAASARAGRGAGRGRACGR